LLATYRFDSREALEAMIQCDVWRSDHHIPLWVRIVVASIDPEARGR